MNCPNCGDPAEALYNRSTFGGNTDTQEYCIKCNPELAKEFGDEQEETSELH